MDLRNRLKDLLERPSTGHAILGVILFNAALLGLETSGAVMDRAGR